MAGDTPSRKRRFRLHRKPEAYQGGTDPAPGAHDAPAEHSALLPSPGARDDERGPSASLEAAGRAGTPADRTTTSATPVKARRLDAVRRGVARSREGARAGLAHLADRLIENAPRVPVRDLATLRRQFPGLGPEQLADKLIAGAANATSTVGAGVGAAAMMPVPPAMPAELAAEITGVAAIELKLIAELHEVYGQRPPGTLKERATAYLTSWTEERGIDVTKPATINAALGGRMKRELRQRIMKRMVRNLPNLMPFMVGAAVGAVMNRRDTKNLAERIRKDLRSRQVPWEALPQLPPLDQPEHPKELGF
ncbi:hypothetical protein [Streptomyces sp. CB03238]|uniref:hypothetical protein n=1 Tax=Streptomyces sp. CB03238 TaxID=1907777 RepID=UPI000A0F973A|nr:hypothetical protein [Streptomyces sp. CB03238]ORT57453.1 hypothetical protein BKD26_24680 [Streptomyces sp. CB03238]